MLGVCDYCDGQALLIAIPGIPETRFRILMGGLSGLFAKKKRACELHTDTLVEELRRLRAASDPVY